MFANGAKYAVNENYVVLCGIAQRIPIVFAVFFKTLR